jgi:hypothetical protein
MLIMPNETKGGGSTNGDHDYVDEYKPISKEDLLQSMDTLDEEIKLTEQMLEEIRNITSNRTADRTNTSTDSNNNTVHRRNDDVRILARLKELEEKVSFFTEKEDLLLTLQNHRKQQLLFNSTTKQKFANIIVDAEQKIVQWYKSMAIAGIHTAQASALDEELGGNSTNITSSITKKMIKKVTYTNVLAVGGLDNLHGENIFDSDESALLAELENELSGSSSLETLNSNGEGGNNNDNNDDNLSLEGSSDILRVNPGSKPEDILQAVQNQLQALINGGSLPGLNAPDATSNVAEALGTALTTAGSASDEANDNSFFDLQNLQAGLLRSLQSLGSSSTTTTTTTTTTASGEISQLVYVAVATNGAPQIRLALPVANDMEEVTTGNLLSSDTLVSSLDGLESLLHGARIANSFNAADEQDAVDNDPMMAMIGVGRFALVKYNEDNKYYSAVISGRMEDGTYQVTYKGVHPWIKAIFAWDGPGYPTQSVMGVAKFDIYPVTSTTKNKALYSDANCWVNADQDMDAIPDMEIKKNDVVYARWQGDRGNMYFDGRIAYIEDDGVSYAVKYNDGDFENFVLPRHIFVRVGL